MGLVWCTTAEHVDAPYRLEVLEDVPHWIPELAAERVGELVTAHVRTAAQALRARHVEAARALVRRGTRLDDLVGAIDAAFG